MRIMMARSKAGILSDYKFELSLALKWKSEGTTEVSATTAGEKLARGRSMVPINEYIDHWQTGILAMEAGDDHTQFDY